eukprot:1743070-Rhodomonas_salina.4
MSAPQFAPQHTRSQSRTSHHSTTRHTPYHYRASHSTRVGSPLTESGSGIRYLSTARRRARGAPYAISSTAHRLGVRGMMR